MGIVRLISLLLVMAACANRLTAAMASLPRAALRATASRARGRASLVSPPSGAQSASQRSLEQPAAAAVARALRPQAAAAPLPPPLASAPRALDPPPASPTVASPAPTPLAEQTAARAPPRRASVDPWSEHAVEGVTIVRTEADAHRVLAQLRALTAATGRFHAVDTETRGVDLKKRGPVGNGEVICLSIFAGEDLDFGNGPCVWVDNWTAPSPAHPLGEKSNLLALFADYLADPSVRKVLHNLSFDRHMLANEGLALGGFAADTMHMARLWDSSLSKANSAMAAAARAAAAEASGADAPAAAAFATAPRDGGGADEDGDEDEDEEGAAASGYSLASLTSALLPRMAKRPMKELFGVAKTKRDGSQSKVSVLPDTLELQQQAASRARFIEYSAHDARATWHLRNELDRRLRGMKWGVSAANGGASATMSEYYDEFIRPFGELLAEIEATGFKVSVERLPAVQQQAEAALGEAERTFRGWAGQQCAHARYMNIGSSAQLSQLLFAPRRAASASGRAPPPELLLPPTTLKSLCEWVPAEVVVQVLGEARAATLADAAADGASALLGGGAEFGGAYAEPPRAVGRPVVGPAKRGPKALALPLSRAFKVEITDEMRATMVAEVDALEGRLVEAARARNCAVPSPAKLAAARDKAIRALARRKHTEIWLSGLGVPAPKLTKAGTPSTSAAVLSELVKSGVVRAHVELAQGAAAAAEAEVALGALMEVSALETMLASFIRPLQELPDRAGRVHSSLNLNTETGRLSSRCPNLQNQPALEKDRFLIRDMFTCEPGNALIVADYEQLELRLLAHMTDCRSMLEAFRLGGDFHSRTAMGMYPEIRAKVERGELLIERERNADGTVVDATKEVPLIKDACANERKKAKVLNFSIAYGKTARGLAQDWKVTVEEAEATLERWYADRPEVRKWQEETIAMAMRTAYVKTFSGRYRRLPGILSKSPAERSHNKRAAINTPVQGTAADVVMIAMIKVHRNERLKELGWKMVLQVHDELILEGPEGSAQEALAIVVDCMEHPYNQPLRVDLKVDAKTDKTWYKAK